MNQNSSLNHSDCTVENGLHGEDNQALECERTAKNGQSIDTNETGPSVNKDSEQQPFPWSEIVFTFCITWCITGYIHSLTYVLDRDGRPAIDG